MAWLEDALEEYKKLPMWGKIAAGGAIVATAGLAYYEHRKGQGATTSNAIGGALTGPSSATDTSGAGGNSSIFPMTNGVPILPPGYNPIYNPSSGTLEGYQQPPPPTPPTGGGTILPAPVPTPGPVRLPPQPSPRPVHPPAPKLKTYTVVKGDNLSEIAAKLHYQGGWQALYAANKGVVGSNPNLIKPGQVLKV